MEMVERIFLLQLESAMDEVTGAFTISDIQNYPTRDKRSSVCQLCQKQHNLCKSDQPLLADAGLKFERAGMQMIRWICGQVIRKSDEDWVKKCMEFRVEGRRPVGRPRRTWLDSVEADMAELEIDREDVYDRKKWTKKVMKRKSNPIGKQTINRYSTI